MAQTDKNIVITPNTGQTADPKVVYSGANATVGAQTITLYVYPDNNGTLSWEGSAGQLFSVTNSLTGTIFSVNDVSGIPSLTVQDTGQVTIAPFAGNVTIGSSTDAGTAKVQVTGNVAANGFIGSGSTLTGINAFGNITVSGGNSTLAANTSDTLTLIAGSGIAITANAAADSITFEATGGSSIFATGGDMGTVTEAVTDSEDLGLVTAAVDISYDLGTIAVDGIVTNDNIADYTITGNKFANNIVITTTGNVTAGNIITSNVIISDGVYYANGQPYSSGSGGDAVYMAIALG